LTSDIDRSELPSDGDHEIKLVLPNRAARSLVRWLRSRCWPDPLYPAATVSSIYYDTPDWRLLREKVNSDFLKTKVRLRWYSDIDGAEPQDRSYLEVKRRVGSQRQKLRVETDVSGGWLSRSGLAAPRLLTLPLLLRARGIALPGPLFPVFQVRYRRLRFAEPRTGARLCIDYDICAPRVNWQMLPRANGFQLRHAVLEVKGRNAEIPEPLRRVAALGCQKRSFSKYAVCYQKVMNAAF
jgi:hypothetical protein